MSYADALQRVGLGLGLSLAWGLTGTATASVISPTPVALSPANATIRPTPASVAPGQIAQAFGDSFYLAPGFLPDPAICSGVSLGGDDASLVCDIGGTVALAQPSHTLTADGDFSYLHIYFGEVSGPSEASEDLILVMYDHQTGDYLCVDDANGSLLPEFAGYVAAGTYDIYVGDFDLSEGSTYNIYLSEF